MLDVVRSGLRRADEVALSVSFVRFSGLQLLVDDLKALVARGGRARILTSTYMGITQPAALRVLATLEGVAVRVHVARQVGFQQVGFHPKFFVFSGDTMECWVGSSNLSKGGLTTNIEANLLQRDPQAVQQTLAAFEAMWERPDVFRLDEALTDAYAQALLEAYFAFPGAMDVPRLPAGVARVATPNPAQIEALGQLERLRNVGESKAVVIAAPGVGKTFLAAFDARAAGAKTVLFLSHRLEHLTQARETFRKVYGLGAKTRLVYGDSREVSADLVFATVQSAVDSKLLERRFDYVIVDEFHHAAAPSYRRLLDQLQPRFLLGLTATPERQDGHDVLALCDFNIAYEIRLIEAINRSWLVPFHYFGIADTTVDYGASFWRSAKLDINKVENALMLEARVDHVLEHALEKGFDGRRRATVGFCAGRRHARFMADVLVRRGFCARALTGEDSLACRIEVYEALQDPNDPLEWLFVADLLNEGVDIPGINSLLFLRPTESATIFIQQLGRGLRLSPDCEVLTVLDFVGHHRNAWLTVATLMDQNAPPGPSTVQDLDFTPPKHCEVMLDDLTREILVKVRAQGRKKKEWCAESYRVLRSEIGPPFPVDLLGRADVPELGDFRAAFGSWLDCRVAMGDAQDWEQRIDAGSAAHDLLMACERDWQQSRVYAYALLWALCRSPEDVNEGYEQFFRRFPRWMVEYAPLESTKVWQTLGKKLGRLVVGGTLRAEIYAAFPSGDVLCMQVERRIQYHLERNYRTRHGGTLRSPSALVLHRAYERPEIINHFGLQYDPALHNIGVIKFRAEAPCPDEIVLITKIDTSGAKTEFQYANRFEGADRFHWQSQNNQRQDNVGGRMILDHEQSQKTLRLFVQPRSHASPTYLGPVRVIAVQGSGPMNVTFGLQFSVPDAVMESLT